MPANEHNLPNPGFRGVIDLYGLTLSALCLLHCVGTPLLLVMMPLTATWFGDHWVHQVIVLLAAPATFLIVRAAGTRGQLVWLAVGGLALLVLAAFVPPLEPWETPITVAGSLALASAHGWRWRSQRNAAAKASEHARTLPHQQDAAEQNALP